MQKITYKAPLLMHWIWDRELDRPITFINGTEKMVSKLTKIKDLNFFFLWFGAAISLSEILTGTFLYPMGFLKGLTAIIVGHVIGTGILVLGGIIGTRTNQTSIGMTQSVFGSYGKVLIALLNVIQLIGWTGIMLKTGADQMSEITETSWKFGMVNVWVIGLGALICLWIVTGKAGISPLNSISVILLILLTLYIFAHVFSTHSSLIKVTGDGSMSFGAGLELTIVMPLSWLPLIADYNRHGQSVKATAMFSWTGYFIGSVWMYVIGLLLGLADKQMDMAAMFHGRALMVAFIVIVLSTVTTTFLDVYSAGVSWNQIFSSFNVKWVSVIIAFIGIGLGLFFPLDRYERFLYLIGSLFSPVYAIVLSKFFFIKSNEERHSRLNLGAVIICIIGVFLYQLFLHLKLPVGATLPSMMMTSLLYVVYERMMMKWMRSKK
ncbi:MAG: putative hydroxymethylpyrimidine transporter CytX [Tuberibacillus sp.]